VNNQLLYAVVSNPRLLGWLSEYIINHRGDPPTLEEFTLHFSRAVVEYGGRHVVLALARSSLEKVSVNWFDETLIHVVLGDGGIFDDDGTEQSTGTGTSTGTAPEQSTGTGTGTGQHRESTGTGTGTGRAQREHGTGTGTGTGTGRKHGNGDRHRTGTEQSTGTGTGTGTGTERTRAPGTKNQYRDGGGNRNRHRDGGTGTGTGTGDGGTGTETRHAVHCDDLNTYSPRSRLTQQGPGLLHRNRDHAQPIHRRWPRHRASLRRTRIGPCSDDDPGSFVMRPACASKAPRRRLGRSAR
jgi:hypothetical protein